MNGNVYECVKKEHKISIICKYVFEQNALIRIVEVTYATVSAYYLLAETLN